MGNGKEQRLICVTMDDFEGAFLSRTSEERLQVVECWVSFVRTKHFRRSGGMRRAARFLNSFIKNAKNHHSDDELVRIRQRINEYLVDYLADQRIAA